MSGIGSGEMRQGGASRALHGAEKGQFGRSNLIVKVFALLFLLLYTKKGVEVQQYA